jgi:hypothetical protein
MTGRDDDTSDTVRQTPVTRRMQSEAPRTPVKWGIRLTDLYGIPRCKGLFMSRFPRAVVAATLVELGVAASLGAGPATGTTAVSVTTTTSATPDILGRQ